MLGPDERRCIVKSGILLILTIIHNISSLSVLNQIFNLFDYYKRNYSTKLNQNRKAYLTKKFK